MHSAGDPLTPRRVLELMVRTISAHLDAVRQLPLAGFHDNTLSLVSGQWQTTPAASDCTPPVY
jgi:hypothetical protein